MKKMLLVAIVATVLFIAGTVVLGRVCRWAAGMRGRWRALVPVPVLNQLTPIRVPRRGNPLDGDEWDAFRKAQESWDLPAFEPAREIERGAL